MAREIFGAELGFGVFEENGDAQAYIISGTAVPDGTSGQQSDAPIGSIYLRSGTGELYQKIANAGAPADWQLNESSSSIGVWRPEYVRAATNDTLAAGNTDPSTWTDNDDGLTDANFTVGDYVIGDADGTAILYEVTAISSPNITLAVASPAMSPDDMFSVRYNLPDPSGQENQAILIKTSSVMVKVADVDWAVATGIVLSGAYAAAAGTVAAGDSVQEAIEKLDGNDAAQDLVIAEIDQNVDDLITLSGVAENSTDFGTFTGDLFADNLDAKSLYQRIEDLLEEIKVLEVTGITTAASVDEVPVATVSACKWLVEAFEEATPANKQALEVYALNNGTVVDDTTYAKLKVGANFNLSISVDISGGNMRLRAASSTAGVTVRARRVQVTNI